MSETKSKIIQSRVTSQDFDTPSKLPQFLHSNGQTAMTVTMVPTVG